MLPRRNPPAPPHRLREALPPRRHHHHPVRPALPLQLEPPLATITRSTISNTRTDTIIHNTMRSKGIQAMRSSSQRHTVRQLPRHLGRQQGRRRQVHPRCGPLVAEGAW
jgi:hypothetical protein